MLCACYKLVSHAAACIEMSSKRLRISIYRNEYALIVTAALNDTLLVCQHRNAYIAVAQSLALAVYFSKS